MNIFLVDTTSAVICRHPQARKGWLHQEGKERLRLRHSNPPVTSVWFYMSKFLHKNQWGCELNQCCNSATQSYLWPWSLIPANERWEETSYWACLNSYGQAIHPCPQEGTRGERRFLSSSGSLSLEVLLGTAAVYLLSAWACSHHWEWERMRDARDLGPWRHCWIFDSTNPGDCFPSVFPVMWDDIFYHLFSLLELDICYYG